MINPQHDFLTEHILVVTLHAKNWDQKLLLDLGILPLCQRECLDITGWPRCISRETSPSLDASRWPSIGPLWVFEYLWFFNSVVDLLEGFVLLMSPDPLAFLHVRRRCGSRISESFCRNLKRDSISPINLCTAGTSLLSYVQWMALRLFWIWTSPLAFSITVSLHYNWNLLSPRKLYFCPAYALIVPHLEDFIDPTIICPGGKG